MTPLGDVSRTHASLHRDQFPPSPKKAALEIHARGQVAYTNSICLSWMNLPGTSPSKGLPRDVDVHGYYFMILCSWRAQWYTTQAQWWLITRAHNDTEEVGMKAASSRYFQHMRFLSCPLRHWKEYHTATTTSRRTKASTQTKTMSTVRVKRIGMDNQSWWQRESGR